MGIYKAKKRPGAQKELTLSFIIPQVNFQEFDWSIERVTFLNVTRFLQEL